MSSKRVWQGNWEGRESTEWTGSIKSLRAKIPTFTQNIFHIGKGRNIYKDLIVREPLCDADVGADLRISHVEFDLGYVEAATRERIPIEAVSNGHRAGLFRGCKQGYKLVEHHTVLDDVLEVLNKYIPPESVRIPDLKSLQGTLGLSIYGARMYISIFLTDADGLHQTHFFNFVEASGGYRDLSLLGCESLSGSPATATFRTTVLTSENNTVALRVIDGAGRSTEQHFSVDFTTLAGSPQNVSANSPVNVRDEVRVANSVEARNQNRADINGDGIVNVQDLVLVANNIGEQGQNRADVNGDGVVNVQDLVLVANALGTSTVSQ